MYLKIKRVIDFSFALVMTITLLPLYVISGVGIWLSMGKPIFFTQKRIGKKNKEFTIYKFRSMQKKTSKDQLDSDRITKFGNFLRVSRIDELPQLINILKGDMSFIGPRPLLPEYLPYYSEMESKRHDVTPGLSGLSQINNLNYPNWDVQLQDDVKYAETISFKMDIWILFKTIEHIFKVKKIAQSNLGQRKNFIEFKKELNNSRS